MEIFSTKEFIKFHYQVHYWTKMTFSFCEIKLKRSFNLFLRGKVIFQVFLPLWKFLLTVTIIFDCRNGLIYLFYYLSICYLNLQERHSFPGRKYEHIALSRQREYSQRYIDLGSGHVRIYLRQWPMANGIDAILNVKYCCVAQMSLKGTVAQEFCLNQECGGLG